MVGVSNFSIHYLFKGGPSDYCATSVHVRLSHRFGDVLRAVVFVVNVASYILQKQIVFTFKNHSYESGLSTTERP